MELNFKVGKPQWLCSGGDTLHAFSPCVFEWSSEKKHTLRYWEWYAENSTRSYAQREIKVHKILSMTKFDMSIGIVIIMYACIYALLLVQVGVC